MKYLCLCYYDPDALAALTPAQQAEIGAACGPHDSLCAQPASLLLKAHFPCLIPGFTSSRSKGNQA